MADRIPYENTLAAYWEQRRRWEGNISVVGRQSQAVVGDLNRLKTFKTGRALLSCVQVCGKEILIDTDSETLSESQYSGEKPVPKLEPKLASTLSCNARVVAWPRKGVDYWSTNADGTAVGSTVAGRSNGRLTEFPGTGKGMRAAVLYAPSRFQNCFILTRVDALFHELVHAYRAARGHITSCRVEGDDYEGVAEGCVAGQIPHFQRTGMGEFYAIVLTNVLRSERGDTRLRGSHASHIVLPEEVADSQAFLANTAQKNALLRFAAEEPLLFRKLAVLKEIPFNPFAALFS